MTCHEVRVGSVVHVSNTDDQVLPVVLQSGSSISKLEIPARSMNRFVLQAGDNRQVDYFEHRAEL
jgi:hypothetical protein